MRSIPARSTECLKALLFRLLLAALCGAALAQSPHTAAAAQQAAPAAQVAPAAAQALDAYRKQTMAFEPNRGQTDPQVDFIARAAGYTAFLMANEAVLVPGASGAPALRMKLVGANPAPRAVAMEPLPGTVNYAGRGDAARSVPAVATYAKVRYAEVYPGVDIVYHSQRRHLEYDFVVTPGADLERITLAFEGMDGLEVDARGDLVLRTAAGELRQPPPLVYQETDEGRQAIPGGYVVKDGHRVGFSVGAHDASRPLVIDPVLQYSTYLGGSDDEGDQIFDPLVGIAVDAAGNAYVAGTTQSLDFPTTPGADRTRNGSQDVFVTKFSPAGAVLYSTYLGGPCADEGRGIAVDAAGNAYVTGHDGGTRCVDGGPAGVLVAKLGPTGTLQYYFAFGARYSEIGRGQAIAVDSSGRAHVTGFTFRPDFPTTAGALRTTACNTTGFSDGFVAKVNAAGTALVYSTFLCGSGHDSPNTIALDAAGNAYVAGSTESHDFPTRNPLQPAHRGPAYTKTGFVTKLSANGTGLVYSTYLGGSVKDAVEALALDGQGNVYVTGGTESDDFPTTPGVVQPTVWNRACYGAACTEAFVAKINPAGSALVYSTFLFGEGWDTGHGIAVDAAGNAYVTGDTTSLYFPIRDAFQVRVRGSLDAFVTKLNPDATRFVYSSYLGGTAMGSQYAAAGSDSGKRVAIDGARNAYVAGITTSRDFPVTPGAFQPGLAGGACDPYGTPCTEAFVTRIAAAGPGVTPATRLSVSPTEAVAGGTLTATWAGIVAPGPNDRFGLYRLGAATLGGASAEIILTPTPTTGGAAAGTRLIALPASLAAGSYELRLLSRELPSTLLSAVARSQPIHAGPRPDLTEIALSNPPSSAVRGATFSATDTVRNLGTNSAGASTTRYYLSLDAAKGAGDVLLAGSRAVPGLAAGASSSASVAVSIPAATLPAAYRLLACADDLNAVVEASDGNNCRASATTVTVNR